MLQKSSTSKATVLWSFLWYYITAVDIVNTGTDACYYQEASIPPGIKADQGVP